MHPGPDPPPVPPAAPDQPQPDQPQPDQPPAPNHPPPPLLLPGAPMMPQDADTFEDVSRAVLAYLQAHVPMQFWAVSRVTSGQQVYLSVTDNPLGLRAGDGPAWRQSLCQVMWEHGGPRIAPQVDQVPQYRHRLAQVSLPVAAYVGIPLLDARGELFGTVCGVDTEPQPAELMEHQPLLDLLGHMLSGMLQLQQRTQQLDRTLARTQHAAQTDPMTGLLNRRGWDLILAAEADRHHQLGDSWSVLVVDLDDLKQINDRSGHAAGDELILLMGTVLTSTSRGHDAVARLGGDEFAVLCPLTDTDQIRGRATRLQEACDLIGLAASIGWATHTPHRSSRHHHSPEHATKQGQSAAHQASGQRIPDQHMLSLQVIETMAEADRCMYAAKWRRKGQAPQE